MFSKTLKLQQNFLLIAPKENVFFSNNAFRSVFKYYIKHSQPITLCQSSNQNEKLSSNLKGSTV
jgi:hypothetical protein